ncbi:MAG: hypothetical protein PS018_21365 [bacterium]|nr:hypothetical protein [bacterium]
MKKFSIVRVGQEYVVKADEKSIIKVSSRRQAARLVTEAAELLDQLAALPAAEETSLACEGEISPDSAEVP